MSLEKIIFYVFSSLMCISALGVISARNSVKAVLCLVLTFFSAAVIWMLLQQEFLAIVLVLVYVGAVMVLFLFVVMMLDIDFAAVRQGFARYLPLGILVSGAFAAALYWIVSSENFGLQSYMAPENRAADYSAIESLGQVLFTEYFYAFEVAAVILLVAMVAAISLAFRGARAGTKTQVVGKQVKVKKQDRLKVLKMDAVVDETVEEADDDSDVLKDSAENAKEDEEKK